MVSTCPVFSKSSISFTNPLGIIPSVPTTIGITVTFLLHIILSYLVSSRYLLLLLLLLFTSYELFTTALVVVFHWNLSDSKSSLFKFPGLFSVWSQRCCSLDCLDSSSDFQLFKFLSQFFGDHSKWVNYNWYHRHPNIPQFSKFSGKVQVLTCLFAFSYFHFVVCLDDKVHEIASSLFVFVAVFYH